MRCAAKGGETLQEETLQGGGEALQRHGGKASSDGQSLRYAAHFRGVLLVLRIANAVEEGVIVAIGVFVLHIVAVSTNALLPGGELVVAPVGRAPQPEEVVAALAE